ncbi:sugar ABC transporter substrate-binding protein [Pseudarthrobacter sp. P1]|uniref:sugar ABC transporter substrate-binding protein n=1 Tax=Pseudarthrobacter sp. P1 TaxID=3418418 RepID=UPI003CF05F33
MNSKSRIVQALAVLAGASLALTACGQGSASTAPTEGGTLTYWSMWKDGEPQQKVIAAAIADFEQQTGATVKVQWQGRSNTEKLVPALNTNNVPDIVDGPYAKLAPVLGDTGQALSLGAAYDTVVEGKKVSELIPAKYTSISNIKGEDGTPWMLPYSLSSDAIWFDAAKHPELVANPPADWDAFIAELAKLKASGAAPLAADGDVAGYNSLWFTTALIRAEGPGSFKTIASDKTGAGWDSPAALTAAKKVEEIAKGGYLIPGYDASKWPAQQQVWASGKASLILNGSWLPTETGTYAAEGFQYSSFPFPAIDGKPTSVRADFVGWAVPKKAKSPELAQQLATFMLHKKYQDDYGTKAKVLPIRADAAFSPQMDSVKKSLDSATSVYQQNDGVTFPGYVEKVFWPIDDQLFLGKISAAEFVAKMKDAQIQYWKDNG